MAGELTSQSAAATAASSALSTAARPSFATMVTTRSKSTHFAARCYAIVLVIDTCSLADHGAAILLGL